VDVEVVVVCARKRVAEAAAKKLSPDQLLRPLRTTYHISDDSSGFASPRRSPSYARCRCMMRCGNAVAVEGGAYLIAAADKLTVHRRSAEMQRSGETQRRTMRTPPYWR
jgi:hypothetical protein